MQWLADCTQGLEDLDVDVAQGYAPGLLLDMPGRDEEEAVGGSDGVRPEPAGLPELAGAVPEVLPRPGMTRNPDELRSRDPGVRRDLVQDPLVGTGRIVSELSLGPHDGQG